LSIQDEQELLSLKAVGRIVRMVLDAMKAEVRPPDSPIVVPRTHGEPLSCPAARPSGLPL